MRIRHKKQLYDVEFQGKFTNKEQDNFLFNFRKDIEYGLTGTKVILENGNVAQFKMVRK